MANGGLKIKKLAVLGPKTYELNAAGNSPEAPKAYGLDTAGATAEELQAAQAAAEAADAAKVTEAAAAADAAKAKSMGTVTGAAAAAAPFVGQAIDPNSEGAGPMLTGAAQGASLGTSIAPGYGTAIGAAIGAGLGMLQADNNVKKNAAKREANAAGAQAEGLQKVANQMKESVNFKFGTSRGSFSSKTKGFS